MALPAYGVLVKWTLHDVLKWLDKEGLSEFKDLFRKQGIDGSKFCKLQETDIDQYYCSNKKKKQLLKNHIASIDRSKATTKLNYSDMWKNQQVQQNAKNTRHTEPEPPPLPPSSRHPPPPPPVDEPDDGDNAYDWGEDFDESGESDVQSESESDDENSQDQPNGSSHMHHDARWLDGQDNYEDPISGRGSPAAPPSSMITSLQNALQKHRESRRMTLPQVPTFLSDHDEDENKDEEDYIEPMQQAPHPPLPPPRRKSTPSMKDEAPSHPAPKPPQPHRKMDHQLPPPPREDDRPSQRQLPPVPGVRTMNRTANALKQNTSENQPQLPPRKTSDKKKSSVPTSRKNTSVEEMKGGYEEMRRPRGNKGSRAEVVEEPPVYDETDELFAYPWYHCTVDRSKAEKLLTAANKDGMFLIRKSTRTGTDQKFTLMIYNQQKVYNLPVRCVGHDQYVLGKHRQNELTFDTLPELIEYFSNQIIQLNPNDKTRTGRTKLIEPLRKI